MMIVIDIIDIVVVVKKGCRTMIICGGMKFGDEQGGTRKRGGKGECGGGGKQMHLSKQKCMLALHKCVNNFRN